MADNKRKDEFEKSPKSALGKAFATIGLLVAVLMLSLVLSISLEWLGMTFWWEAEGAGHSHRMLIQEVSYLQSDFRRALLGGSPAELALKGVALVYGWVVVRTGFLRLHTTLSAPVTATEPSLMVFLKRLYSRTADYLAAAGNTLQVFTVRLMVIVLSAPIYLLVGTGALVDGLVQRDLRRYGAGIEHGLVYHKFKAYLKPMIVLPAFFYLAVPAAVHPNLVFVPAATLFGLAIFVTAATFKKFL